MHTVSAAVGIPKPTHASVFTSIATSVASNTCTEQHVARDAHALIKSNYVISTRHDVFNMHALHYRTPPHVTRTASRVHRMQSTGHAHRTHTGSTRQLIVYVGVCGPLGPKVPVMEQNVSQHVQPVGAGFPGVCERHGDGQHALVHATSTAAPCASVVATKHHTGHGRSM